MKARLSMCFQFVQRLTSAFFLLFYSILCLTGCDDDVVVPASDPTPPTVKLSVIGVDGAPMLTESTPEAEITVDAFQRFSVLATATDTDGGVQNITLSFSETIYYDLPGDPAGMSTGDGYVDNPISAVVGSTVPATRAVARAIEIRDIRERTPESGTFRSLTLTFRAIAENFHDGETHSARLTVRHP